MNLSKVTKRAMFPIMAAIVLIVVFTCGISRVDAQTTFTENLTISGDGGSASATKKPNPNDGMTVKEKPSWVTSITNTPAGMKISANKNTGSKREGKVVIESNGIRYEYSVSQAHGHTYVLKTIQEATYISEGINKLQCSCGSSTGGNITISKKKATVTLDANGGSIDASKSTFSVTYGDKYQTLDSKTPNRKDYVFLGWYTYPSSGDRITETNTVKWAGDHTLYAHWGYLFLKDSSGTKNKKLNATVSYSEGSYTFDIDCSASGSQYWFVKDANSSSETEQPKWITSVSSSGNAITIKYKKNTTINQKNYAYLCVYNNSLNTYAYCILTQGVPVTRTVSFDPKGGTSVPSITVVNGEKYGTLSSPTKKGYTFSGWYKKDGKLANSNDKVTADHTLEARWNPKKYWVNFKPNGGDPVQDLEVAFDGNYKGLADRDSSRNTGVKVGTLDEYQFLGWYKGTNGGTRVLETTIVNEDATPVLYAHWLKRLPYSNAKSGDYTIKLDDKGTDLVGFFIDPDNKRSVTALATNNAKYPKWVTNVNMDNKNGKVTFTFQTNTSGGSRYALYYVYSKNNAKATVYKIGQDPMPKYWVDFRPNGGDPVQDLEVTLEGNYKGLADRDSSRNTGVKVGTLDEYQFLGWYKGTNGGTRVLETTIVNEDATPVLYAHWLKRLPFFNAKNGYYTIKLDDKGTDLVGFFIDPDNKRSITALATNDAKYPNWITNVNMDNKNGKVTFTFQANTSGGNRYALYYVYSKSSAKATVYKIGQDPMPKYWVDFRPNGGEPVQDLEVTLEGTYKGLADRDSTRNTGVKIGTFDEYQFLGWYKGKNGGTRVLETTIVSEDATPVLYAHWLKRLPYFSATKGAYTITLDNKGTDWTGYFIDPDNKRSLTALSTSDAKFPNWITNVNLDKNGKLSFSLQANTDGKERYALYYVYSKSSARATVYKISQTSTITITYHSEDYPWKEGAVKTQTIQWGQKLLDAGSVPVKPGYKCTGWQTSKDSGVKAYNLGQVVSMQDIALDLYPYWEAYKVTYHPNAGGKIVTGMPESHAWDYNYKNISSAVPEREGYTFVGWHTQDDPNHIYYWDYLEGRPINGSKHAKISYVPSGDITLYAVWRPETISSNDGGYTYNYDGWIKPGEVVEVEVNIPEGYSGYYRIIDRSYSTLKVSLKDQDGNEIVGLESQRKYWFSGEGWVFAFNDYASTVPDNPKRERRKLYLVLECSKNINAVPAKADVRIETEKISTEYLSADTSVFFKGYIPDGITYYDPGVPYSDGNFIDNNIWEVYVSSEDLLAYLTMRSYTMKLNQALKSDDKYADDWLLEEIVPFCGEVVFTGITSLLPGEIGFGVSASRYTTERLYAFFTTEYRQYWSEGLTPRDWLEDEVLWSGKKGADSYEVRVDIVLEKVGEREVLKYITKCDAKPELSKEISFDADQYMNLTEVIKGREDKKIWFNYTHYLECEYGVHLTIDPINKVIACVNGKEHLGVLPWVGGPISIRPGVFGKMSVYDHTTEPTSIDVAEGYLAETEYSWLDALALLDQISPVKDGFDRTPLKSVDQTDYITLYGLSTYVGD